MNGCHLKYTYRLKYRCVIDQAWGQDGWILAKFFFFFFVFIDRDRVEVHKLAKKKKKKNGANFRPFCRERLVKNGFIFIFFLIF